MAFQQHDLFFFFFFLTPFQPPSIKFWNIPTPTVRAKHNNATYYSIYVYLSVVRCTDAKQRTICKAGLTQKALLHQHRNWLQRCWKGKRGSRGYSSHWPQYARLRSAEISDGSNTEIVFCCVNVHGSWFSSDTVIAKRRFVGTSDVLYHV